MQSTSMATESGSYGKPLHGGYPQALVGSTTGQRADSRAGWAASTCASFEVVDFETNPLRGSLLTDLTYVPDFVKFREILVKFGEFNSGKNSDKVCSKSNEILTKIGKTKNAIVCSPVKINWIELYSNSAASDLWSFELHFLHL